MQVPQPLGASLMTTDPIILPPEATIAQALASARRADIPPALAAIMFVCRPPLETPTGRYLGAIHLQRALREPPSMLIGSIIDKDVAGIHPDASIGQVTRLLATYDQTAIPVVDEGLLVGAVSVDDVLDHLLPEDWRDTEHDDEAFTDQEFTPFGEADTSRDANSRETKEARNV